MDKGSKQSSSRDEEKLLGWTKKEKFDLFQYLKAVGSHDIESIHIPSKTPEQIKSAIDYYKSKALNKRFHYKKGKGGRPRTEVNLKPSLPLSHWAKYLTDNISYDDLQTEVATALRLIAEFEAIPQALCTEYVDFRKAYHLLANAIEGKNLQDDKFITMLITKSIVETAMTSKVFVQNTTVKQIVEQIDINSDKDIKNFQRPITNKELAIVQHFSEQKNYNPFNISEEFLRSTKD